LPADDLEDAVTKETNRVNQAPLNGSIDAFLLDETDQQLTTRIAGLPSGYKRNRRELGAALIEMHDRLARRGRSGPARAQNASSQSHRHKDIGHIRIISEQMPRPVGGIRKRFCHGWPNWPKLPSSAKLVVTHMQTGGKLSRDLQPLLRWVVHFIRVQT
jgi:hypothetical protein